MNHYQFPGGDLPPGGPGHVPPPPGPYHYPIAPNPYKRPIRRNSNIVAGGLILLEALSYVVSTAIVEALVFLLPLETRMNFSPALLQLIYIAIYVIGFSVPIAVMVAVIRIPVRVAFPMRKVRPSLAFSSIFFCLGVGLLGSLISNLISALFRYYTGYSPVQPDISAPIGLPANILYFISVAILPAILEEMMFRGVIMQSLRRFGDGFALVISSMLFSFCHGNLIQGPPTFLVGLAIGYFVLRTGSLATGMLIHFANNALAISIEWLLEQGSDLTVFFTGIAFYLIYIGGAVVALLYLVTRHTHMFRVAPSNYPMYESQKYGLFFSSLLPIVYLIITIYSTVKWFA